MRDSDWSRQNLLRSDWLLLIGATITTLDIQVHGKQLSRRLYPSSHHKQFPSNHCTKSLLFPLLSSSLQLTSNLK